jgi:LPXTG-site transpeptidase (sortase) family protein
MKTKILSRRTLLIVIIVEIVISVVLVLISYFIPKYSADSSLALPAENVVIPPIQEQPSFGLPVRLKIPEINIDAAIEYVGLKANGEMDVAKDPAAVAWLQIGTRPGDIGSAVIAGHYGILKNGEGSIFDNLKKLNKGDQLYIEDDKGATITFVIRESRSYDADADASSVFTSGDGKSHLNLVTCQGWDNASESYTKRLVIFTDKE